ncbi:hypothetical protein D3C85_1060040 [compost metagenome]
MLNMKDYRPLVLPLGMILVVYSLVVYPNVVYMIQFDTQAYIPYAITIGLMYPLLILVIGAIRKPIAKNKNT